MQRSLRLSGALQLHIGPVRDNSHGVLHHAGKVPRHVLLFQSFGLGRGLSDHPRQTVPLHKLGIKTQSAALEGHGIEWEVFQLGAAPVRDCIGCGKCGELDCACVFDDDMVNELIKAAQQADGFIFGTPVYYAHPTGRILSVLDRAFYAGGAAFEHKPGAAIAVARRGGITASFDVLNKYFTIKQMPVVASTYWNGVHGRVPGEAALDEEGMRTMRNIGHNMAWMLKCIELGRENGIEPPVAETGAMTNFIR